jgi:hypothetical protein
MRRLSGSMEKPYREARGRSAAVIIVTPSSASPDLVQRSCVTAHAVGHLRLNTVAAFQWLQLERPVERSGLLLWGNQGFCFADRAAVLGFGALLLLRPVRLGSRTGGHRTTPEAWNWQQLTRQSMVTDDKTGLP